MLLLPASIVLYAVEYVWTVNYLAGITAAILLTIWFAWINFGVPKGLVVAAGLFIGLVLAWLCRTAKRARLNKIHDL
jgi:hypothetical protein